MEWHFLPSRFHYVKMLKGVEKDMLYNFSEQLESFTSQVIQVMKRIRKLSSIVNFLDIIWYYPSLQYKMRDD